MQCLISLSDGVAGYAIPLYSSFALQSRPKARLFPPCANSARHRGCASGTVDGMCDAEHGVVRALMLLLSTNISDVLQPLAPSAGSLTLPSPHDPFLTALAKAALPSRVAWNFITSHFVSIIRNRSVPQPIRVQAARQWTTSCSLHRPVAYRHCP